MTCKKFKVCSSATLPSKSSPIFSNEKRVIAYYFWAEISDPLSKFPVEALFDSLLTFQEISSSLQTKIMCFSFSE